MQFQGLWRIQHPHHRVPNERGNRQSRKEIGRNHCRKQEIGSRRTPLRPAALTWVHLGPLTLLPGCVWERPAAILTVHDGGQQLPPLCHGHGAPSAPQGGRGNVCPCYCLRGLVSDGHNNSTVPKMGSESRRHSHTDSSRALAKTKFLNLRSSEQEPEL